MLVLAPDMPYFILLIPASSMTVPGSSKCASVRIIVVSIYLHVTLNAHVFYVVVPVVVTN